MEGHRGRRMREGRLETELWDEGTGSAMSAEDDADEKRRGSPAMQKTWEMGTVTGNTASPRGRREMRDVSAIEEDAASAGVTVSASVRHNFSREQRLRIGCERFRHQLLHWQSAPFSRLNLSSFAS